MIPDGFVLAGGRSRRMGFDKARAPVRSPPVAMAAAVAESLRVHGGRVAIVRRGDDGLPWIGTDGAPIEVVWERERPSTHPLYGVATALAASRTELCAIAPCDAPDLTPQVWEALFDAAPAVAWDGERVSPLVAVLWTGLADRALALAEAGAPAHALAEGLRRVALSASVLADRDVRERIHSPVRALLDRVPISDPGYRERLATGERTRLAARGILDPG